MGWTTGTKQPSMTLQVEVEFDRIDNVAIDNCPRWAITASIAFIFRLWEEPNVVPLADNDKGNCGFEPHFLACAYGEVWNHTRYIEGKGIRLIRGSSSSRTVAN
jgi:hypothetical protein